MTMGTEFNRQMSRLGGESAFEVLAKVNDLMRYGKDVISFCIGEPDFDTPKYIRDAAKKALDEGHTHYNPGPGLLEVRRAIADYVSRTRHVEYGPENIIVAPGGKPILFMSMMILLNEGDEAIYPTPGYPIYESLIHYQGAVMKPLLLHEERGFVFDINELKSAITSATKLLVLNSPQNPTGGVIPKEDLKKIAELAVKHDFFVFSDEIYSRIVYDAGFESIAQFPGMKERTIILDGHSKTYAMTGWRFGYGAMPMPLAKRMAQWISNIHSCTAGFVQIAGKAALEGPQDEVKKMVATFKRRRDIIVKLLNDIPGVSCHKPLGAFYVFPNVTKVCRQMGFEDAKHLYLYLLYDAHVAVLPRIFFGARPEEETQEYIRLSYATSEQNIREGLKRMKEALTDRKRIKHWLEKSCKV